jgi:hypothetical protein
MTRRSRALIHRVRLRDALRSPQLSGISRSLATVALMVAALYRSPWSEYERRIAIWTGYRPVDRLPPGARAGHVLVAR